MWGNPEETLFFPNEKIIIAKSINREYENIPLSGTTGIMNGCKLFSTFMNMET
jgi:hypothetical protein